MARRPRTRRGCRVRTHHLRVAELAFGAGVPVLDRTVAPRHPRHRDRREIDQSRIVVGIDAEMVHDLAKHPRVKLTVSTGRNGRSGRCRLASPSALSTPRSLWFESPPRPTTRPMGRSHIPPDLGVWRFASSDSVILVTLGSQFANVSQGFGEIVNEGRGAWDGASAGRRATSTRPAHVHRAASCQHPLGTEESAPSRQVPAIPFG